MSKSERGSARPHVYTDEWAARARAALAARSNPDERDHRWLASQVGCSGPAISMLLNGKWVTSQFIGPVSDVLGISPPHAAIDGEDDELVLEALHELRAANPDRYRRIIGNLLSAAKAEREAAAAEKLDGDNGEDG